MESSFKEIVCPIDVEWKFKKADLMDLEDTENGFLNGKIFFAFNIPGIIYFIRIYPYRHDEDSLGQTFIFFYANGSEERTIIADYTVSIKSADYTRKHYNVYDDDNGCGKEVCKTAEFFESKSKYFINGEITIKVKGTLKVKRSSVSISSSYISTQWKIKLDDLKEIMNDEPNTYLYSKDVNVKSFFDIKYYLGICPNRIMDEKEAATYLSLHVKNRKQKKIDAVFNFSIYSANFNNDTQHVFHDDFHGLGIRFCLTEDLFDPSKGYFVDGYITINFQGVLMAENNRFFTLHCKKGVYEKSVMTNDDKDFVIVAEGKDIKVHKNILSDVSPVFARMLESGMKEAIENKMHISDFSFKIIDISIKLCYGKSILLKFSLETLLSIYRFGNKYRIGIITDLIEEYLIKEISPMNIVYLIKFSAPDSFNVKKLHQSCIEYFIKCSKVSTPIYASESLGEKLLATIILSSLCPNVDTHISDDTDDYLHTAVSVVSTDTDDSDTDDDSLTEYTTVSTDMDDTDIDD